MEKTISSAEAKRRFSQLLRDVCEGRSYVVTNHGLPVARISPVADNATIGGREKLLQRVRSQPVRNVGRWRREDLYEKH